MKTQLKISALLLLVLAHVTCGGAMAAEQSATETAPEPVLRTATPGLSYAGALSKDGKISHFLAIPFARAPIGDLRWRAPQPPQLPPGRHAATAFAPACMQGMHMVNWYRGVVQDFGGDPGSFPVPEFDEDCLYLNIWRPEQSDGPLPVLVYFHGGSNRGGWAYEPNYIGEKLARQDLIVVSIPYRLGVFGFLAHPALQERNFGLLDAIAGLQWLAENIAHAGGDPQRITIMGESAGAGLVQYLLVSPQARGLFQRAISQSYGRGITSASDPEPHLQAGLALQESLQLSAGIAGLDRLRELPAQAVLEAAEDVYDGLYFEAVIDPATLPFSLATAMQRRQFATVPLLAGSNLNEWRMYISDGQTVTAWLDDTLPDGVSQADRRAALRALVSTEGSESARLDRLISAADFDCPTLELAGAVRREGQVAWVYHFTRQRPGPQAAIMGAYHGAELPYLFDTHDAWLPTDAVDRQLGHSMMRYWANFTRTGDPNGPGLTPWLAYEPHTASAQVLDERISAQVHRSRPLCDQLSLAGAGRE